jgi:hypothetical protein
MPPTILPEELHKLAVTELFFFKSDARTGDAEQYLPLLVTDRNH